MATPDATDRSLPPGPAVAPSATAPVTPAAPAMYTPAQLRLLKFAVIAMGVVLVVGFAAVIGRIVYLVNSAPHPRSEPAAAVRASAPATLPPISLPPISLPKGAVIRHIALSGSRIAIEFEVAGVPALRIVDLDKGGSGLTAPIVEDAAPAP